MLNRNFMDAFVLLDSDNCAALTCNFIAQLT